MFFEKQKSIMEKIFHIEAEKIILSFDHRRKLHS